jgi:hypothetical protein
MSITFRKYSQTTRQNPQILVGSISPILVKINTKLNKLADQTDNPLMMMAIAVHLKIKLVQ